MSGRGQRLHRQDVADHLLAGRAQAPPGARLRAGLLRRAVPHRAAGVRPHDLPRRGGAVARLPVGQRLPRRRLVPRLRHVHDDPGRLRRAGEHLAGHAPRRQPLRRPRRRALPGLQPRLLGPPRPRAGVGARVQPVRRARSGRTRRTTRCPRSRSCGCPTTTPTARRRARPSPRPTSPTTTSRWGGWCRRSRTARSGPTPRSWSPRTTPRTGPTTSTPTARSAYVISPYTQTAKVDHTHYDTASMVATVESLLNLPPMTIVDQRATRMWKGFSATPDFRPVRRADAEGDPARGPGGADQRARPRRWRRRPRGGTSGSRTRRRRSGSTRRSGSPSTGGGRTCRRRGTTTSSARSPPTPSG